MITHFLYNFKMEWWFIKLYSYIMSNKAESFHLIQIFPPLQLAPVTFRPCLLMKIYSESPQITELRSRGFWSDDNNM